MFSVIVVLLLFLGVGVSAQQPSSVPEIPFEAETPLTLPPELYFGEVAGVAVNSHGHVFVGASSTSSGGFTRSTACRRTSCGSASS